MPGRLANKLDATMSETKKLYDAAHGMGLRDPSETEMDAYDIQSQVDLDVTVLMKRFQTAKKNTLTR